MKQGAKDLETPKTVVLTEPEDETTEETESQEIQERMENKEEVEWLKIIQAQELDGGQVQLFRKKKNETNFAYVGSIEKTSFTLDEVKRLYGGGYFHCKAMTSRNKIFKTFRITIDLDAKPESEQKILQQAATPDIVALAKEMKGNNSDSIIPLIMQMNQQAIQQQQANTVLLVQMFQTTQENNVKLIAALSGGRRQEPLADLITAFSPLLQEVMKRKEGGDTLGQIEKLLELKQRLQLLDAPEENKESFMDMLKPLIGVGMTMLQPRPQQIIKQIPSQQNIVPMPKPVTEQPQEQTQMKTVIEESVSVLDKLKMSITTYFPMLLNMAKTDCDPVSVVEMVTANCSESEYKILIDALAKENWKEVVFSNDARMDNHITWFEELRKAFIEDAKERLSNIEKPQPSVS